MSDHMTPDLVSGEHSLVAKDEEVAVCVCMCVCVCIGGSGLLQDDSGSNELANNYQSSNTLMYSIVQGKYYGMKSFSYYNTKFNYQSSGSGTA